MANDSLFMYTRNHFYIDPDVQHIISNSRVVLLGTGLSSTLAEVLVRTGFKNIFLCDGDLVEHSNLNRQNFINNDIGRSKVFALQKRLLEINSDIDCIIRDQRIETMTQMKDTLEDADIIINTVDCGPIYFELIESCRKMGKLVICPFNVGFGGLAVCFTENSGSAFEFFETEGNSDDYEVARCLLRKPKVTLAEQVGKPREEFFAAVKKEGYFPQLGIGSAITAGIVATACVDFLKQKEILVAPKFHYLSAN